MSRFFINRPIVAIVISIIMVILGALSIKSLPVEQYPNIVPPQIKIAATYPGADCQTVAQSVASPIEQQMSGVDKMDYMTSVNANNGMMSMTVVFEVGSDPDTDQILTYLRYGQATAQLPGEVSQMGVTLSKSTGIPIVLYSLTSPKKTHDNIWLTNYAFVNLVDAIKRIKGVGDVQVFGSGRYAMRIWLDPDRMTSLNISVSEVANAIKSQNTVNPAGKIGAEPAPAGQERTYTIRAKGRLSTAEEFSNIIVRGSGDAVVRIKDIATVDLGSQSYDTLARTNGELSSAIAISQMPGSNAIDVADEIAVLFENLKLPPDVKISKSMDTTLPVRAGIEEIVQTLLEALGLVIIVVFVFLQGWRATLIPAFAVPVSIIGTFAVFPLIGFTVNTICLMGMVLAIGLVVDDAIVVVEAVEHHMDQGKSPKEATIAAMDEVSGPVVAIALVLSAVFLPSLLLPGITGSLFQQFAVTIAISILISAFNALTLSPALSAIMLKPKDPNRRGLLTGFYNAFNKMFGGVQNFYTRTCSMLIRKMVITVLLLIGMTAIILPMSERIPGGFLPEEDQGFLFVVMQLPDASSLQMTTAAAKQAEEILQGFPGVQTVTGISGFNMITGVQSSYNAFFFVSLIPWKDRKDPGMSAAALTARATKELGEKVTGGISFAFAPPAIPGVGTSGGVTMMIQDRGGNGQAFLTENTKTFIATAQARPEVLTINNSMAPSVPQYYVEVDEGKATIQGVNVSNVYQTLQAYMGSLFVNYFTLYDQQWQVYLQANAGSRSNISELNKFNVQGRDGVSVPITSLVTSKMVFAPEFLLRQNMYNSSQLNITGRPGYSSAQVMSALEQVFEETMPDGMGYEYSGMSFQEKKAQEGMSLSSIFALSAVFCFLILAALYESWTLPIAVFLTVPVAVVGAFGGLLMQGLDLNLYAQIGLIMLIGLAGKNAILIVEFAVIELDRGKSLIDATLSAAQVRLRPILMTSFAFILGCVPLAMASGSGAIARRVIGVSVIGGMTVATVVGVFLIPASFYLVKRLTGMRRHDVAAGSRSGE